MKTINQLRDQMLEWLNVSLHCTAAAITAVLLIIGWGVTRGLSAQTDHLRTLQHENETCLARAEAIRQECDDLNARLKAKNDEVESARARLPDVPQEARFIAQLSE